MMNDVEMTTATEQGGESSDMSIVLMLNKKSKNVVVLSESFDLNRFSCRRIAYVGVFIESIKSTCSTLCDLCQGDVIIAIDGEPMYTISENQFKSKFLKRDGSKRVFTVAPAEIAQPILKDLQDKDLEGKKEIDKTFLNQYSNEFEMVTSFGEKDTAVDLSILYRLRKLARTVTTPSGSLGIRFRCIPYVGIYIDRVKQTSPLFNIVFSGDVIIAVDGESTHLSSVIELCSKLSQDANQRVFFVVPADEARPILEALYLKNIKEKDKIKLKNEKPKDDMNEKIGFQSTVKRDEPMDLIVLLRLRKIAKTVVAPRGWLGWVCRSIPYVGICIDYVEPTSPLRNVVCKGDVIIAVNEESTHLTSTNDFNAMASNIDSRRLFTVAPAWIAQYVLDGSDLKYTETKGWIREESKRVDVTSEETLCRRRQRDAENSSMRNLSRAKRKGTIIDCIVPCNGVKYEREKILRHCLSCCNSSKRQKKGTIIDCVVPCKGVKYEREKIRNYCNDNSVCIPNSKCSSTERMEVYSDRQKASKTSTKRRKKKNVTKQQNKVKHGDKITNTVISKIPHDEEKDSTLLAVRCEEETLYENRNFTNECVRTLPQKKRNTGFDDSYSSSKQKSNSTIIDCVLPCKGLEFERKKLTEMNHERTTNVILCLEDQDIAL